MQFIVQGGSIFVAVGVDVFMTMIVVVCVIGSMRMTMHSRLCINVFVFMHVDSGCLSHYRDLHTRFSVGDR